MVLTKICCFSVNLPSNQSKDAHATSGWQDQSEAQILLRVLQDVNVVSSECGKLWVTAKRRVSKDFPYKSRWTFGEMLPNGLDVRAILSSNSELIGEIAWMWEWRSQGKASWAIRCFHFCWLGIVKPVGTIPPIQTKHKNLVGDVGVGDLHIYNHLHLYETIPLGCFLS